MRIRSTRGRIGHIVVRDNLFGEFVNMKILKNLTKNTNSRHVNVLLISLFAIFLFSGCGKTVKKPEQMTFNELKDKALVAIDKKKNSDAIEHLEQLIAQYPENQDIFEYKFALADLYLKLGRLEEAYNLYKHYTRFYPSETRTEEAHYKSILSKFYQTLKVSKNCDDTDTRKTLERCKEYLNNEHFENYRSDVRDISYTCERRLIDKEIYVFNTYLRRKKYQSAKNRIAYLRTMFLEKHPSLEAQILFLESKLAHKQNDGDLAKEKVEDLFDKYPESRFTKMAQNFVSNKKRFIF